MCRISPNNVSLLHHHNHNFNLDADWCIIFRNSLYHVANGGLKDFLWDRGSRCRHRKKTNSMEKAQAPSWAALIRSLNIKRSMATGALGRELKENSAVYWIMPSEESSSLWQTAHCFYRRWERGRISGVLTHGVTRSWQRCVAPLV